MNIRYFHRGTLRAEVASPHPLIRKKERDVGEHICQLSNSGYWGKGIMTQMVKEVCGLAFCRFPIDAIFAEHYEWNAASQKVLEKAGFVYKGAKEKSRVYTLVKSKV